MRRVEHPLTFGHAGQAGPQGHGLPQRSRHQDDATHSPPDGEAMRVICYMGQTVIDPEQG